MKSMSYITAFIIIFIFPSVLLANGGVAQCLPGDSVRYEVIFNTFWSEESHPRDFPDGAHFSSLVGAVHGAQVSFWGPGKPASWGLELIAENGRAAARDRDRRRARGKRGVEIIDFTQIVDRAINRGQAKEMISGPSIGNGVGQSTAQFEVNREHSQITLLSMIAPSPDWFVGVRDLNLCMNDQWVTELSLPLYVYDAGTDSGVTFESPNADIEPRLLVERSNFGNFVDTPVGEFVIRKIIE